MACLISSVKVSISARINNHPDYRNTFPPDETTRQQSRAANL